MISAVLDRLKTVCPSLRLFGRAADLAALEAAQGGPRAIPAVYAFIKEEAAAENERATGNLLQRNEVDLALLLITRNVSDAAGGAAATDIEALVRDVRQALLGWVPADGFAPFEAGSGRIIGLRNSYVRYEIILTTAHYLEAT